MSRNVVVFCVFVTKKSERRTVYLSHAPMGRELDVGKYRRNPRERHKLNHIGPPRKRVMVDNLMLVYDNMRIIEARL